MLMQADGMNDNLSAPPPHAFHSPKGTAVPDREGITGNHPSATPQQERESQAATPLTSPQQERESQATTPLTSPQQERESQAATPLPASKNNRYRQTAVKAALAIFLFI